MRTAIFPAASFILFASCASAPPKQDSGEVHTTLRRIDVVSADFSQMELAVVFAVDNPTSSDVAVNVTADIGALGEADEADGAGGSVVAGSAAPATERAQGTARGTATAFQTSEIRVPVRFALPADAKALEQIVSWKKMQMDVKGKVDVGGRAEAVDGAREVAPPQLPIAVLKEAQVASGDQGANGAGFFKVLLDNRNPFPVTVDQFAWSIRIQDKELRAAGNGEGVESIPASAVIEYESTVELNEAAFGKELKVILNKPSVPYVVEGFYEVRGIRKAFRFAGDMKFPR